MRRMSLMAGLAASVGMMAAMTAAQHTPERPKSAREEAEAEKTPRQRKRWLQRQARKKSRLNR